MTGMSDQPSPDVLSYYRRPGAITRLDAYGEFLDWLTGDVYALYQVVQGLLVHDSWIEHYGGVLDWSHSYDTNIAYMTDLLDKALDLDAHSLALPRGIDRRVICCCREFATLLCAMLRYKGIPARSRCGFATYFDLERYEDHWVCEYWDAAASRWVLADPQIDPFQRSFLHMQADPLDLPPGAFISAAEAWLGCRTGRIDPGACGISCDPAEFGLESLFGLWFVRGQLLRDFAALNKVETVPFLVRLGKGLDWSDWPLLAARDADLDTPELALLDQAAELAFRPDENFDSIRRLYAETPMLQPGPGILAQR